MAKIINCSLLANRDFSGTVTVSTSGEDDKVFLSIAIPTELKTKNHRLDIRTPGADKIQTIELIADSLTSKISFVIRTDVFDANGDYFIHYLNEDGQSKNCLRLSVKDLKNVPAYGLERYLPISNYDHTRNKIVSFIDNLKGLYYDAAEGKFYFMQPDGTTMIVDIEVESIIDPTTPPYWDDATKELVITFAGGTVVRIPLTFDIYLKGVIVSGVSLTPDENQKVTIPIADALTEQDGLLTYTDKQKLDALAVGIDCGEIETEEE